MSTYTQDDKTFSIPTLWQNITTAEEWYYLIEKAKDTAFVNPKKKYDSIYDQDGDEIDPGMVILMKDFGFESPAHWESFHFQYSEQKWNINGEEQMQFIWRMSDIGRKRLQKEITEVESKDGGVLAPIEGISVELWAKAQARMASGGTLEEAYQICNCDAAKWDRVSGEWLARMSNDTEFKIMTIYSAAFNTSATGNMGAGSETNDNTISFEKFVEAMAAQDVLCKQGRDAQSVLADFGMTVADYSNISSHWFGKMASDYNLGLKFAELQTEYTQKYEAMAGSAHDDLEF